MSEQKLSMRAVSDLQLAIAASGLPVNAVYVVAELYTQRNQLLAALQREVSNCPTCGGEESLSLLCPRCKESRELLESIR